MALVIKNLLTKAENTKDMGLIPGTGRFPEGGKGNPLWHFCLENPMDRGTWRATVHGVAKESDMTEQLNSNMDLSVSVM